ncbi:MAG: hypothetical protein V7637_1094 [Mycobacteriales bacterium]
MSALAFGALVDPAGADAGVGPGAPAGALTPYYRQPVAWHICTIGPEDRVGQALDAAGAKCAEVTVPLDYRRPGGPTISVAVSRIRAADPAHRRGMLLVNPGGPGGAAIQYVLIKQLIPQVVARYDLVGMDPRFVGRSTPLRCRWDTDTFLRSAGPDRASYAQSVALARTLAAGCVAGNLDRLPYASTRNTVRDIDVIRGALGEPRLSYLGYSYGTYLGAVYLQMFGARADRFVLDSAVDPTVYGPGVLSRNGPAAAAALLHWAAWAAGQQDRYGLGATTEAVLSTVERINRAAVRAPLRVGEFLVDSHVVPYWLFLRLGDDSPEAYASLAAEVRVLDAAAHGGPATPTPSLREFLTGLFTGAGDASDRAGTPILCADRDVSHNPDTYFRAIQAHRADEPLFGPLTRNLTPCAFWPVRPVEPPTVIHTAAPVLMVGADGDPVTPYPGQQAMHRALTGSRLVTLHGAVRHGVYLDAGNTCADATVNQYLMDGVRPAGDITCAT